MNYHITQRVSVNRELQRSAQLINQIPISKPPTAGRGAHGRARPTEAAGAADRGPFRLRRSPPASPTRGLPGENTGQVEVRSKALLTLRPLLYGSQFWTTSSLAAIHARAASSGSMPPKMSTITAAICSGVQ